jgi:hypothetical protein
VKRTVTQSASLSGATLVQIQDFISSCYQMGAPADTVISTTQRQVQDYPIQKWVTDIRVTWDTE